MISFNEPIFQNHKDTLKNTSLDKVHHVYMTNLTNDCVDFDEVKTEYLSGNSNLKSCDALYSHDRGHILIEFKNGDFSTNDIRIKIADSLLIISDIKNLNIVDISKNEMEFILVYNAGATKIAASLGSIHSHMGAKSGTEIIHFNLEQYKGVYFKDVHTYTATEFDNYINSL